VEIGHKSEQVRSNLQSGQCSSLPSSSGRPKEQQAKLETDYRHHGDEGVRSAIPKLLPK
jgi:hypothetical protein